MSDRPIIRLATSRREPVVDAGGQGPRDPGIQARLARVEGDLSTMRADLSATRADTSYIRGRLESLPTTWQMIAAVMAGNLTLCGLLFAAIKLAIPPLSASR